MSDIETDSNETFGFGLITGQDVIGTVHQTREAIKLVNDAGGEIIDLSYQVLGGHSHCTSVIYTIDRKLVDEVNRRIDHLEAPPDAGTSIRRNREPGAEFKEAQAAAKG